MYGVNRSNTFKSTTYMRSWAHERSNSATLPRSNPSRVSSWLPPIHDSRILEFDASLRLVPCWIKLCTSSDSR